MAVPAGGELAGYYGGGGARPAVVSAEESWPWGAGGPVAGHCAERDPGRQQYAESCGRSRKLCAAPIAFRAANFAT